MTSVFRALPASPSELRFPSTSSERSGRFTLSDLFMEHRTTYVRQRTAQLNAYFIGTPFNLSHSSRIAGYSRRANECFQLFEACLSFFRFVFNQPRIHHTQIGNRAPFDLVRSTFVLPVSIPLFMSAKDVCSKDQPRFSHSLAPVEISSRS